MGSLSKLFLDFHDENSLTKTYKEKITKGRDALRNKIGNKFEEKGRKKPQHCTQGSYAMKTAIMPLDIIWVYHWQRLSAYLQCFVYIHFKGYPFLRFDENAWNNAKTD